MTWSVKLPDIAESSSDDDRLPLPTDLHASVGISREGPFIHSRTTFNLRWRHLPWPLQCIHMTSVLCCLGEDCLAGSHQPDVQSNSKLSEQPRRTFLTIR